MENAAVLLWWINSDKKMTRHALERWKYEMWNTHVGELSRFIFEQGEGNQMFALRFVWYLSFSEGKTQKKVEGSREEKVAFVSITKSPAMIIEIESCMK